MHTRLKVATAALIAVINRVVVKVFIFYPFVVFRRRLVRRSGYTTEMGWIYFPMIGTFSEAFFQTLDSAEQPGSTRPACASTEMRCYPLS